MSYPDELNPNDKLEKSNFAENDTEMLPLGDYLFSNGYKNVSENISSAVPNAHEHNWLFNKLYKNLRYTQEVARENKNLLATKIATPTTIGQIKVGYGLEITSNGTLSVTTGVAENANIISYDLPVGSYMLWGGKNPPDYFIEPKGQTLNKEQYPELFQYAQENDLIGKLFTYNEGEEYFTVKDIRDSFISIANSDDKVGVYTEDGLPNITAKFRAECQGDGDTEGAVSSTRRTSGVQSDGAYGQENIYTFNASNVNAIYGKNERVMPRNWGLKIILKALPTPPTNAVPIGTILDYSSPSAPYGYIIANGAELSRTTFKSLFDWVNSNNLLKNQNEIPNTPHCFYGSGNGTTTFTIPNLLGVHKRNVDTQHQLGGTDFGKYLEDGLPNITGKFNVVHRTNNNKFYAEGCLYSVKNYNTAKYGGGGFPSRASQMGFDASLSNPIYSKSEYVQPKSVSTLPIIRAY